MGPGPSSSRISDALLLVPPLPSPRRPDQQPAAACHNLLDELPKQDTGPDPPNRASARWQGIAGSDCSALVPRRHPTSVEVLESRQLLPEEQVDGAGGSVSMLRHDDLGYPRLLRVLLVVVIAVKEHDDVRVLLDAPTLPQVAEDGSLVRPGLRRSRELRDGDDRRLQLSGNRLQAARYGGHLLDAVAVVAAASPVHQLEVVEDDHLDPLPRPRLPGLETQRQVVQGRGVVDVDGSVPQRPEGARQALVLDVT